MRSASLVTGKQVSSSSLFPVAVARTDSRTAIKSVASDSRAVKLLGIFAGPWRRHAGFRIIGRRQGHPALQFGFRISNDLPGMGIGGAPAFNPELVRSRPIGHVDFGRSL